MADGGIWIVIALIVVGGFALMAIPRLTMLADRRRAAADPAPDRPQPVGTTIERGGGIREVYLGTNPLRVHVMAAALQGRGCQVEVNERRLAGAGADLTEVSLRYAVDDEAAVRAEIDRAGS